MKSKLKTNKENEHKYWYIKINKISTACYIWVNVMSPEPGTHAA